MAKRKSKSRKNNGLILSDTSAKAIVAFLVLMIAFGVLMLFNNYQDNIIESSSFQFFILLVVILFALLVGLVFLLNPQKK